MQNVPSLHDLASSRLHQLFPTAEMTLQLDRCRVKACVWPSLAAGYCRQALGGTGGATLDAALDQRN